MTHLIIAIDGPASSGKGTLAVNLAQTFDLAHLDTGLLYRKVGLEAIRNHIAPDDAAAATALAQKMGQTLNWGDLADPDLRGADASHGSSVYGAIPGVRAALLEIQRHFAHHPPTHLDGRPCHGAVLDGRDIGTVICPTAPIKFYVTASAETRAQRRVKYLIERGFPADYDTILRDLVERDTRDSTRATAPLKPAPDAILVDTDDKTIDDVLAEAAACVSSWLANHK